MQDVLRYSLVGDLIDQEFFYLNEDSGFISLRKTLLTTTTSQFRVRARPSVPFRNLIVQGMSTPLCPLSQPLSSEYVHAALSLFTTS